MDNKNIRVRYAPSPTGHLHIGNARTAIFNWLFARHYNGEFIIRIEDTDLERNIENGEKSQLDNLEWLGIDWDEGPDKGSEIPYRQSERKDIYKKYIDFLLENGFAYKSYKTPEQIAEERENQISNKIAPHYINEYAGMSEEEIKAFNKKHEENNDDFVVRLKVPENVDFEWEDIVKGKMKISSNEVGGDWVIQKANGMPTYNFAVVIDDHLMNISHVLRGDDHVSNTPRQLMIYDIFEWDRPKFGHMALIINSETGKKLSKRDESILQFVEQYKDLGYLPEALFNFIGLLGWSPVGENEIFTIDEFKEMFDEKRLTKANAKFDSKKLDWINNQWIKNSIDKVIDLSIDQLIKDNLISEDYSKANKAQLKKILVSAGIDGITHISEVTNLVEYPFFKLKTLSDDKKEWIDDDNDRKVISLFLNKINNLEKDNFNQENIMKIIKEVQNESEIKGKNLWNPLRVSTTNEVQGPNLPEILEIFGKEKTIENIENTLIRKNSKEDNFYD